MSVQKQVIGLELQPELMDCLKQNQEIMTRVEHMLTGMTLEQFNWRPIPGRWSIAQNINHLNLEYREQIPVVEKLIKTGKQNNTTGVSNYRHGWFGNFYCWFLEPPYRAKVPTLDRFKPPADLSFEDCVPEFMKHKQHVFELIVEANGLHLAKLKAPVTYLKRGNWSLSLGQWLRFFAIHERRHLWQIEQFVLGDVNFPKEQM
jgi:hypothetical protein